MKIANIEAINQDGYIMNDHEKILSNFKDVTGGETPVLVDFFATWCGPCKMMAPVLEDIKKRFGEKLRIIKLDIDNSKNAKVVQQYGVRSVPTLMIFRRGELLWRESGVRSANDMESILNNYIA